MGGRSRNEDDTLLLLGLSGLLPHSSLLLVDYTELPELLGTSEKRKTAKVSLPKEALIIEPLIAKWQITYLHPA